MSGEFTNLVIVGGGTAGWLSACILAARRPELAITLIEAPDIPTVGVGEGSWPTLRETLAVIGIDETEFLKECDASFKQGSRFDGWVDGSERDCYYHPFSAPLSGAMPDILTAWKMQNDGQPYAEAVSPQAAICNRDLAPRQRTMPPFAGALNYGYHLDAGKFGALLASHGIKKLGVRHVHGKVTRTERGVDGLFTRLLLDNGSAIEGDFFIDCTGMASKLMGEELGIGWVDRSNVSFNDRALAVQVPVVPDSAIASQTIGTAHRAGWLWDIGLPTRRGVVATCNYEARKFGIHSAMAAATARKLCPQLIIIHPDMDKYRQASRQIHEIFEAYTSVIEPLSLDEAFLDVSDCELYQGSATLIAQAIRAEVKSRVNITISAGIAPNKFLAKIASDWNKPDGQFVITPAQVDGFVQKLAVAKLHGVGKVTAGKMKRLGISTCSDLRKLDEEELKSKFGSFGTS